MRWLPVALAVAVGSALLAGDARRADAEVITIGTGGRAGVYFQVGRALCRLVNARGAETGTGCEARSTAGSIANLRDLRAGALTVAVVQSDWQYHAVHGTRVFEAAGADEGLRALFSVHGEPFTVLARRDSGIASLADFPGKRVNIGNPGSGQRATMEVVMAALGWTKSSFALANELDADEQSLALCHDRVQALVYTVGHPNPSVAQAAELCDARIVPAEGAAIDTLVAANPFYAKTLVPGSLYPGNPDPVATFGVKATLVSSAAVSTETVHLLVETLFESLDAFKAMHPAFRELTRERMVVDGLTAPLHEGARRYYARAGLM